MSAIKNLFTDLAKAFGYLVAIIIFVGVLGAIGTQAAKYAPNEEKDEGKVINTVGECETATDFADKAFDDSRKNADIKTIIANQKELGADEDTAVKIATMVDSHYASNGSRIGATNRVARSCYGQNQDFQVGEE